MISNTRSAAEARRRAPATTAYLQFLATVLLSVASSAPVALAANARFTLPAENAMPAPLMSVPFPSDLYFDQGQPGDGDGTLLNSGSNVGISVVAANANFSPVIERGLDTLTGWGVSTGCHVAFDATIDVASLPGSPNVAPSVADSVLLMNLSTGALVPIKLAADVDSSISDVLSIIPIPGNVLDATTTYACVVTSGVTSVALPVTATAAFVSARDRTSANSDANDIYGDAADAVVTFAGIARASIVGMAVFTTMDANDELVAIQTTVLPGLAAPTANFSFATNDLVFDTPAELDAALGSLPHDDIAVVATGYFDAPRFQTPDPNGTGKTEDLPNLTNLAAPCTVTCETDDERFVDVAPTDGLPDVQSTPLIPFTVVIPDSPAPVGGYPIIIDQHGLGGDRAIVVQLGDALAERGFASIGIDAVMHGYRFHDPRGIEPNNGNQADVANNFPGGTTIPDGFADGGFFGFPLGAISVQLGFFNAFTNLVGVRDNFRQTCVDLMSLVRLIQSNSIDTALGVSIDESNIFYMGHSLGGIMGSCAAAFENDVKAYVLNAPGGGLTSQLLVNSSIGAGSLESLFTIFGLTSSNVLDDVSIFVNVTQALLDAGDPVTKGPHWIGDPMVGGPRNLLMVADHQDEVVPNQANEALAHAAGLELFRPYLANPLIHPVPFALTSSPGSVSANGPGGVTAVLLQQGPASHAFTFFPALFGGQSASSLSFVPGHALVDEWGGDGSAAFPSLDRAIRIQNESVLDAALDWLDDIVQNGVPGTFAFSPTQNPNPRENQSLASGAETLTFFDRSVDGILAADSTPNVVVDLSANTAAGRLTASRSTLGTSLVANNDDMPPDVDILGSGVLPFFLSLQKNPAGAFTAEVAVTYTAAELSAAAIADESLEEAALSLVRVGGPGTCAFDGGVCTGSEDCPAGDVCIEILASSVDTLSNTVTATGLTAFSTFAVMNPATFSPAVRVQGGGSTKKDCVAGFLIQNPAQLADVDSKGRGTTKHTCTQGDPSCDFDSDPAQCTFRVGLCFRTPDPALPDCPLSSVGDTMTVEQYEVRKPSEKDVLNPNKPAAGANRGELLRVVDDVLALPTTETDTCATMLIQVPLKDGVKKGKEKLGIIATGTLDTKPVKDSDKLGLTCEP